MLKQEGWLLAFELLAFVDLLCQVKIPNIWVMGNGDACNVYHGEVTGVQRPFSIFLKTPEVALRFSYYTATNACISEENGKLNLFMPFQGLPPYPLSFLQNAK